RELIRDGSVAAPNGRSSPAEDHSASGSSMTMDKYLSDLPLLHTWDGGKTWNTGGFYREIFQAIQPSLTEGMEIIAKGAGNYTIFFLLHKPRRLVSIAPDAKLFKRIELFCDQNGINRSALQKEIGYSEWTLPKMAAAGEQYDFVLIDGNHGWPAVF